MIKGVAYSLLLIGQLYRKSNTWLPYTQLNRESGELAITLPFFWLIENIFFNFIKLKHAVLNDTANSMGGLNDITTFGIIKKGLFAPIVDTHFQLCQAYIKSRYYLIYFPHLSCRVRNKDRFLTSSVNAERRSHLSFGAMLIRLGTWPRTHNTVILLSDSVWWLLLYTSWPSSCSVNLVYTGDLCCSGLNSRMLGGLSNQNPTVYSETRAVKTLRAVG